MGNSATTTATETARAYYDSDDADNFYARIWGGEDIHIGLYEAAGESIAEASRRTVERMAELAAPIDASTRVLDIGSGYAGSLRWLATHFDCPCVGLNLSQRENERAHVRNREAGLSDRIQIVDGAFESLPFADASFDLVWSQEALLHSSDRPRVLAEVARVLTPGGRFVFTDPMRAEDSPTNVLEPILARLKLSDLASPGFYRTHLADLGVEFLDFEEHNAQLVEHYRRVREELLERRSELSESISTNFIDRMEKGLQHWVDGGRAGHLVWGIFLFQKV